jgi:hypothetical protein
MVHELGRGLPFDDEQPAVDGARHRLVCLAVFDPLIGLPSRSHPASTN